MTDPSSTDPRTPDTQAAAPAAKSEAPAARSEAPAAKSPAPRSRPRWGLRLLLLLLLLLLVALFLGWRGCLPGQGGGGSGKGKGKGMGAADMAEGGDDRGQGSTCDLRVDVKGISVSGKLVASPDEAVTACGESRRALLRVTGDAIFGTVDRLEAALRAKGFTVQREKPPAAASDPPAR